MSPGRRVRAAAPTFFALGSLLVASTLPCEVRAQSWRGQAAWVAGRVGGGIVGLEARRPLGAPPPLPLPGSPGAGPTEARSRAWHVTGMAGLGVNGASPDGAGGRDLEPLGYLHVGVLGRTGRAAPAYVGLLVSGYVPVGVVGPAAYVEAADVAALQVGALYGEGAWRGHAGLTLSIRFLGDVLGG